MLRDATQWEELPSPDTDASPYALTMGADGTISAINADGKIYLSSFPFDGNNEWVQVVAPVFRWSSETDVTQVVITNNIDDGSNTIFVVSDSQVYFASSSDDEWSSQRFNDAAVTVNETSGTILAVTRDRYISRTLRTIFSIVRSSPNAISTPEVVRIAGDSVIMIDAIGELYVHSGFNWTRFATALVPPALNRIVGAGGHSGGRG